MECSLHTTDPNPRSPAISAADSDISPKGSGDTIAEIMTAFERLSLEGKTAFLDYPRWEVQDGRAETDPRNGSGYFEWLADRKAA